MCYVVMDNGFTEEDWDDLFYYIKEQSITPFLGSGIARDIFGTGSDLAKVISDEFGYPFSDTDNLSKVAQFAVIKKKDSYRIRKFVADYIRNKKLPDFDNPHEPHRILSELDLPLYITTNYDHSMYESLIDQGKKPVIEFCRWNDLAEMKGNQSIFEENDIKFDSQSPLIYHLHGEIDNPQSMVLTEDDYLNFIVKLYVDIDQLFPAEIRNAFVSNSLVFIGYSLSDWNLRIILRRIAEGMKSASRTHCSIQLTPTGIQSIGEDKIKEYLSSYLEIIQGVKLKIFWGNALDFCNQLSEKNKKYGKKANVLLP
jgi:hypothetical protein